MFWSTFRWQKSSFDQVWALERFEQHGVKLTTKRQTMTEWSLPASDEGLASARRAA
jgi:hypothetical protein